MLTYILGPFLAVFPKRWREALPFPGYVRWAQATAISGIAESAGALAALSYWYSYAMTTWVGHGVDFALNGAMTGKSGPEIRPQDIGAAALIVWVSHPLTWLLGYFGLEGALRLGAALTGSGLGTLPFFVLDKTLFRPFGRAADPLRETGGGGGLREMVAGARLRSVSDEIRLRRDGGAEFLEICASRKKDGWDPPRTVRYQDAYYRLEAASMGNRPRPFRYICGDCRRACPGAACCSMRRLMW